MRVLGVLGVLAACWTSSPKPELVPPEPAIEIDRRPECREMPRIVDPDPAPVIDVKPPVIDVKPSPPPNLRPRLKPNPYV